MMIAHSLMFLLNLPIEKELRLFKIVSAVISLQIRIAWLEVLLT